MQYIYITIIISSLMLWTGCSDKKDHIYNKGTITQKITPKKKVQRDFMITDIDNRSTTISFSKNKIKIAKIRQPIVIINIFSDWSPPSKGMMPYLNDLQKKYSKDIFMIGIPANSDTSDAKLRNFMKQHDVSYFISNNTDNDKLALRLAKLLKLGDNYPIPLTIVFKDGKYIMHYIGATPVEMIESDIKLLRRK